MKKCLVLILLSVFTLISCSSKVVIEENTKNNKILNKYNITVREIKDNFDYDYQVFKPLYFKDNNIYGINDVRINGEVKEGEANVPIKLNSKGEFIENDDEGLKEFIEDPLRRNYTIQASGINSEGLHTRDNTYYYYDLRENIKFYLKDLDKFFYEIEEVSKLKSEEVYDLENYYIVEIICHESPEGLEGNYDAIEMTAKATIIIDKANKTYYKTEINKETPYVYYFDEKENSIMALNYLGEIKKIILEDGRINYLDYKNVVLEGFGGYTLFDYLMIRKFVNDNYVVLSVYIDGEHKTFIYDIKNGEIKLNSEDFIVDNVDNTNYFIINSDDGNYLSTINKNMEFELLCKLFNYGYYDNITIIGNRKNVFALLEKYNFENERSYLEDKKYLLVNIEEN